MKLLTKNNGDLALQVELDPSQGAVFFVMGLNAFQARVKAWVDTRLPGWESTDAYVSLTEEVGSLGCAVLKKRSGSRFTEIGIAQMEREKAADILLALLDFCARRGFSLGEVAQEVFEKKSNTSYDLVRVADKRRGDAARDLEKALEESMKESLLEYGSGRWGTPSMQSALGALSASWGLPREDVVRHIEEAAGKMRAEKEPTP